MTYSALVSYFLKICLGILAACVLACLCRAIKGPRTSDRLVAVNMAGTQIICIIAVFCVISGETGFIDIALIYAMISFVSVAVITRLIGRRHKK